ncbi:MAG: ATP synthase F1 subunit delta [Bacteroidota bacterium]|jgi:F-type H+-transporting ATPase subunit delta
MTTNKIAFRYAKSWIDLALERNEVESALADVKVLKNLLRVNADFSAFVKSPVISYDKKKNILSTLFEDKLSKLTLLFLQLLVTKHREINLPLIVDSFLSQYKTLKEISTVKVISAQPLIKEDQEKIIKMASASIVGFKNIELETVVDESLIGGFIIEMEDYVYDASVKNQIFRLKKSFAENLYESKIIAR